jgi:hypothetical protein
MGTRSAARRVGLVISVTLAAGTSRTAHSGDARVGGRGRARTTGTPGGGSCRGRVAAATCIGGRRLASVSAPMARYAVAVACCRACAYNVSGAMSASLGHTIVPASASARS